MDKKQSRLRRSRQTRAKIAELKVNRLAVHRTNLHIYASIIAPDATVLASASTAEAEVRKDYEAQFIAENRELLEQMRDRFR